LFSGDLGRPDDLIMNPPDKAPAADTVLIESTYGDRKHPKEDVLAELGPALQKLVKRGGIAVVPVFAVGRAQALLHAINQLKRQGLIPASLPVYLDSPMAVNTTHLFVHHLGEHRLSKQEAFALTHAATMVSSTDDSRALEGKKGPMIILSASGMATGGRVLHHLSHYAGDPKNMIILTGFQPPGTRGATLASGGKMVRIHGRDVQVHAEVIQLQSASAHADANQILAWLSTMPQAPQQLYVVHGELGAADELRKRLQNEKGWRAMVPEHGSTWRA
jgi:metallo-beta-lactamase family protein